MKHTSVATWQHNQNFSTSFDDTDRELQVTESGGQGFSPKRLMLAGLIGCTGLDVASTLKKMRAEPEGMELKVEADLTETPPKVYSKVHVIYSFYGKNLQKDKIERAVDLSLSKYCGVSKMFENFAEFSHEIRYPSE